MTINAATGAKFALGGVQNTKEPALVDYQADSYVEVGEIETLGNFGDTSSTITFTSLSDSRVRKLKGPRDAGDMTITVGDDPDDEGQAAMVGAEATTFDYNCRVTLNDAKTPGGSGSVHYFKAKIMSKQLQVGTATDVVKRNFSAAINSAITSVDPT